MVHHLFVQGHRISYHGIVRCFRGEKSRSLVSKKQMLWMYFIIGHLAEFNFWARWTSSIVLVFPSTSACCHCTYKVKDGKSDWKISNKDYILWCSRNPCWGRGLHPILQINTDKASDSSFDLHMQKGHQGWHETGFKHAANVSKQGHICSQVSPYSIWSFLAISCEEIATFRPHLGCQWRQVHSSCSWHWRHVGPIQTDLPRLDAQTVQDHCPLRLCYSPHPWSPAEYCIFLYHDP